MYLFTQLINILALFGVAQACITSRSVRELAKNQNEDTKSASVNITYPVPLTVSQNVALDQLEGQRAYKRQRPEFDFKLAKEGPSAIESSTATSESSNATTTTESYKSNTIDDPNFIPGSFLDSHGNAKLITPPKVTDILQDFLKNMEVKQPVLWSVGGIVLVCIAAQGLLIVTFIVACSDARLVKTLPQDKEDKMRQARLLAAEYRRKPQLFNHLKGFVMPKPLTMPIAHQPKSVVEKTPSKVEKPPSLVEKKPLPQVIGSKKGQKKKMNFPVKHARHKKHEIRSYTKK